MRLRNESTTEMPRLWVWPNMRPPAAAVVSTRRSISSSRRPEPTPNVIGTLDSTARSRIASSTASRRSGSMPRLNSRRDLEDAGAEVAQDPDEPADLVPRREPGRDRSIVGRLVLVGARGGEPDRTGLHRVAQLALHERELVVGRARVEGALAHHVRAQRRVADLRGVVDALRPPVDRVEVLGEGLPLPVDARRPVRRHRCLRRARGCGRRAHARRRARERG